MTLRDRFTLWDRFRTALWWERGPEQGGTPKPDAASRRSIERKRQRLMDGLICSERMPAPRPCTICDMTDRGAKVELWTSDSKPSRPGDRITLYVTGDRKEVDGKVVWRKENFMGLRFMSEFHAPTRQYN
jgi:hypothetical protein